MNEARNVSKRDMQMENTISWFKCMPVGKCKQI